MLVIISSDSLDCALYSGVGCVQKTHTYDAFFGIFVFEGLVLFCFTSFFFSFFFYLRKKNLISWCVWWCVLHWRAGWLFWWNFLSHFFLKTHLTNSQTSLVSAHGCSGCYPLLSKDMHMVAPSETMSKQHEASRWNQPFMLRLALTAPVYDFTIIYTATTAL